MPRFIMNRIYKAPLNSKKVYTEDNSYFLIGYGETHNILLYEDSKETKEYFDKISTFKNNSIKIKLKRKFWNIKNVYNYLYKLSNESNVVSNEPLPKYEKVKDIIYRNIYDKSETNLIMNKTDTDLYGIDWNKITNYLFIGGIYNIETSISMESVLREIGEDKATFEREVSYYAVCSEVVAIEDNPLTIKPFEYYKYMPTSNGGSTDKRYQIEAMKAIGLSEDFIDEWKEGETVVTILWDENVYDQCYPPISGYGPDVFNQYWDMGDDDDEYEL